MFSVDLFAFVKEHFPFRNKNEMIEFACNLMYEIGRVFGCANIKDAEEKIRVLFESNKNSNYNYNYNNHNNNSNDD
jgi:hypothetical protein